MAKIMGGKIVSIGNGGDGIRISSDSYYNISETFVSGNGGAGFAVSDGKAFPPDLYRAFLQHVASSDTISQQVIENAGRESGLAQWFADNGIELAAFVVDFAEKAQNYEWLKEIFKNYLGV